MGSIVDLGRWRIPWSNEARTPQLLSLCPRAHEPRQEKPPQRESRALQRRATTTQHGQKKKVEILPLPSTSGLETKESQAPAFHCTVRISSGPDPSPPPSTSHCIPEEELPTEWTAWWPQGFQSRAWQRPEEDSPDIISFQETSGASCPALGNGLSSWCWEVMKLLQS